MNDNCDYREVSKGIFECQRPGCGRRNQTPLPEMPEGICRVAPAVSATDYNAQAIKTHGASRTDAEVFAILTTFCAFCPSYRPDAPKRKCLYGGCPSTDTTAAVLRRRVRNCPWRRNHPAKWTEATLQRHLHPSQPPGQL